MTRFHVGSRMSLVVGAVLAAACAHDGGSPFEPVRPWTGAELQVAAASTDFGLTLLREVSAGETTKPNLIISPLSASMALGMALNGADGETLVAMRHTLGFGDLAQADVNAAYRGLVAQLHARDPKVEFTLANSMWYRQGFPVFPSFVDTVRTAFGAEVRALDFADPASPGIISNWAEQQTNGRIKDLVKEIQPAEVMFLVNAVYFKAPWSKKFETGNTAALPFLRADGASVNAPTMSREGTYRVLVNADLRAAELFYGDSAFTIVLLAPATGSSLEPVLPRLQPERWSALLDSLRARPARLYLPKFTFDYARRLNGDLAQMGMAIAFDMQHANFGRIADLSTLPGNLYISRVDQKAFVKLDESGTEAAAATNVGIGMTSAPPPPLEVRFDRPFLYLIRERSSGAILFAGRVGDPTAPATS